MYKKIRMESTKRTETGFSVVTSGNGHNLKLRRLLLYIKKCFTVRMVKHMHRLSRGFVESLSLEIRQLSRCGPGQLALGVPA